ncbi:MAG: DinB family protein [Planctomycetota bacterium]|jgi:uncharacterized damage-inducible protein DinB
MNTPPPLAAAFTSSCIDYLTQGPPRIERALAHLSEEEIWQAPSPTLVSPANLVLHLCGNITQYVLSCLGGKPDHRQRDLEFSAGRADHPDLPKADLVARLTRVIDDADGVICQLTEAQLVRAYRVQGFDMTGAAILVHVTEHLSYHVGQIAWHVKATKGVDLGFYADRDLNVHNDPS